MNKETLTNLMENLSTFDRPDYAKNYKLTSNKIVLDKIKNIFKEKVSETLSKDKLLSPIVENPENYKLNMMFIPRYSSLYLEECEENKIELKLL